MFNISQLAKGLFPVLLANAALASPPKKGPVVVDYGPVFEVPATAYNLKAGVRYRVSMDVAATAADQTAVNRNLESAARFLNMQAQAGTPMADLELAVVVHGPAARDLLTDDAYFEQFGLPNPNSGLLSGLQTAGVAVYICGQTAAYQGFQPADFHAGVTMALSAITAHARLQAEGFTLTPF